MTAPASQTYDVPVATAPTLYRLSPERYDRIVDAGLLEDEPVELVEGLLVRVSPQGAAHYALIQRLTVHFAARADLLRIQAPLAVPDGRPEPDIALAPTPTSLRHPETAALVVEVAVSAWGEAVAKLPSYARAGVGVVWIVDAPGRAVHVHERPGSGAYAVTCVLRTGDLLVAPAEGIPPLPVEELFAVLDR